MPELPDITVYLEALQSRVVGEVLEKIRVLDVFVLRTALPPISSLEGRRITGLRRLGKRLAFGFEGGAWLVLHLMIAGRLHWVDKSAKARKGTALAEFNFVHGTLTLTEAGSKRRASLHVVQGVSELEQFNRGGLDVMSASEAQFDSRLRAENHTLKRALTDPRILDGIGNAYSDEILWEAKLSPFALTQKLTSAEIERLFTAVKDALTEWVERLRAETGDKFPEKVTAFHPEMAVHGKFGKPCPVCATAVQRIRYAENEVNYCPRCQTGGKVLADRSLSRLLKSDWPRSIDEWEERKK